MYEFPNGGAENPRCRKGIEKPNIRLAYTKLKTNFPE